MKRIASVAAIAALLYLGAAQATNVLVVNITGQVFSGPSCMIIGNSAGRIEASFGDALRTDMIDGNNYKVPIPFSLSCTGTPSNNLRLQFNGGGSTFDPAVLGTNIPNLGVQLLKPDGNPLALGESFIFSYSPVAAPALQAVPVKRAGSTLSAGAFGASTILLLEVL